MSNTIVKPPVGTTQANLSVDGLCSQSTADRSDEPLNAQGGIVLHKLALTATAERLDRLMTLEIRPLSGGLPAGIVVPTYIIARTKQGGALCEIAATHLYKAAVASKHVLVVTGAGVAPKLPHGETDGPPGAGVLALALWDATGTEPILVSQAEHLPAVHAVGDALRERRDGRPIIVLEFPKGQNEAVSKAREMLDRYRPGAVVFVERDGPNEAGHYHGVRGDRRPLDAVAHLHVLATEARKRGILTVGIGDGGNEIGFGMIREEVSELLPKGGRSQPDETGVVTVAATDILVTASVSNWGCYAICGAMSVIAGRNLLHRHEDERKLISACISADARDGATGKADFAVDGVDADGNGCVVTLMRTIVDAAIAVDPASENRNRIEPH